jgi:hypothetical protein
VLIEEMSIGDVPGDFTKVWQVVHLAAGSDHKQFPVTLPITGEQTYITFSLEGLARLKMGLQRAGLYASFFSWPPEHDLKRPPYRGLRPLEADDAGIFLGREAPVIKAIDLLRGLREAAPPRLRELAGLAERYSRFRSFSIASTSWPGLSRPSTSFSAAARQKARRGCPRQARA